MKRRGWEILPFVAMFALILSSSATVYYLLRLESEETQSRARAELERLVQFISEGMTEPVWALIPEDGRPLAEALLRDDRVYRVQVTSTIQGLFLNVEGQGAAPAQRTIVRQSVTRQGEVIGHVEVTFDDEVVARAASPGWSEVYWVIIAHVLVTAGAAILVYALADRMRKTRARVERAELEARRIRSEERFEEVQRIAHIGHWARDAEQDTIRFSREAGRILGIDGVEGRELSMDDFLARVHPDDRERVQAALSANGGEFERFVIDARALESEGYARHLSLIGQPVEAHGHGGPVLEGTIQDVTERKALENQLQHSERMKAIGQLTGGIAHDFNNLLTVIRGNLQLLARKADATEQPQAVRWIDSALRSVDRGADLTQHLLAFARRQRLVASVVDVNRLVRGMGEMLDRALGEATTVDYRLDDGVSRILADDTELESAILNLALNARDAMPGGGTLTIASANVAVAGSERDELTELEPGEYVRISVDDTGVGMTPEVRSQAFEPFFTTKKEGKGTGLGLSTIFGFTKQSGGHAIIRSEPGEGTRVELYFPVHEAAPESEPLVSTSGVGDRETIGGSERILLVDDNDAVRETTRSMLEELGYSVKTASDGTEAMRIIEGREDIDLLLTDVVMPGGMNGLELAARTRQRRPDLSIICASGYAEASWRESAEEREGYVWMDKPFDFDQLASTIRRVLANARS